VKRPSRAAVVPLLALCVGPAGCDRQAREQARALTATVEQALRPPFFVTALRKMGGGHFHGTARFAVTPEGDSSDAVTTTTDVWLDREGNYRLLESNDRDGGREVILYGRELAVALRYGKMIRRVAEDPEPTQLLEEALGGPWAAWEVVASGALIQSGSPQLVGGASAAQYRIAKDDVPQPPPDDLPALRRWRGTVTIAELLGEVLIDERSGALVKADLQSAFTLTEDKRPMKGAIDVHATVSDAAAVPPIARPVAEELTLRQRIVPEQKEMLRGLGGRVPPPPAPPPAKKKKGRRP